VAASGNFLGTEAQRHLRARRGASRRKDQDRQIAKEVTAGWIATTADGSGFRRIQGQDRETMTGVKMTILVAVINPAVPGASRFWN